MIAEVSFQGSTQPSIATTASMIYPPGHMNTNQGHGGMIYPSGQPPSSEGPIYPTDHFTTTTSAHNYSKNDGRLNLHHRYGFVMIEEKLLGRW